MNESTESVAEIIRLNVLTFIDKLTEELDEEGYITPQVEWSTDWDGFREELEIKVAEIAREELEGIGITERSER